MKTSARCSLVARLTPGFTLVELIVVILVIVVLAVILTPTILMAMDRAYSTKCMNNLKQIGTAIQNYANTYKEYLPFGGGVRQGDVAPFQCMRKELSNPAVVICPSDPAEGQRFDWQGLEHQGLPACSYTWTRDAIEFQTKLVNIQRPSTLGLIADGMVAVTGVDGWVSIQPKFDKKDRKSANQWVHQQQYLNFLYADGHVDRMDIKEMGGVRFDPRAREVED